MIRDVIAAAPISAVLTAIGLVAFGFALWLDNRGAWKWRKRT